ncbi:hypothetical protein HUN08_13855 [Gordonia sp. X0973]|uniref:hypothetical protein n=1 Tax=Gordonia sp. X0973 TaxID=2742602 RepID=UPI000F54554E|nr:hypothetical protein [Gordonia sp. X0973]QKT08154.1 hypothetical protein HUN08_13855 [Gordonia sp. X0973]
MATYVLDGKSAATLARRPLAVSLAVSGAPNPHGVRLVARTRAGGPAAGVVETSPALLILPRVAEEVVIAAVPAGSELFASGTTVHVSIGPDGTADYEADIAQLTPRDVSGLGFIELASIAPGAGDTLSVTTRLTVPDGTLPPVAAAARIATRGVIRADRVPESQARPVRLLVDTSASMAAHFSSGMVAAAADIVAGMGAVVAGTPEVSVGYASPASPPPAPVPADRVGSTFAAAPAAGYALSGGLAVAPAPGTLTVLLTDSVGAVEPAADQVLLVLSESAAAAGPGLRGAVLAPVADPGTALVAQPDRIGRVVAALLAPVGLGGAR